MTRQTRPELYPGLSITEGMLIPIDRSLPPIPLKHTALRAGIIGPLCHVQVKQTFHNTHTRPVEAIYVFPLPEDAAVSHLTLQIGERTITGAIREREQAQHDYAQARDTGLGAALLEQERPNIFTVSVANIQPDEKVQVVLEFYDQVPYENDAFECVLPTVVLPRYVPEDPTATPDAGRLTTPLLPEGQRDGHTLSIHVELDVGKLTSISSPSHDIDVQKQRATTIVTLKEAESIPNKDFILRYRVAGNQFETAAFTYRAGRQPGTVLLMLTPQLDPDPSAVMPREVLFVLDRSGSMGGASIVQARNALRSCLRALNPGDTFNIFPFDDRVEQFASRSLPFTQQHIDESETYISQIDARGGTEILKALQQAFEQPRDPERLRVVVFLTDGAVGNEDQVLRNLRRSLNEARVYAFGIGSAVNRFLLDKLAEVGRGRVEYIFPGQDIEDAVQRFQNQAAFPLLTNVQVDWGTTAVTDAYPQPLPDLYAGQPLLVMARFHHAGSSTVRLRGTTRKGQYEQVLEMEWPEETTDRGEHWAALPRVWARMRMDALMSKERDEPEQKSRIRDEILGLALVHHLLSPYTALIAVEERRPEHAGREEAERVMVPIHLPQGTLRDAFESQVYPSGPGFMSRGFAPAVAAAPMSAPQQSMRKVRAFFQKASSGIADMMAPRTLTPGPMEQERDGGIAFSLASPEPAAKQPAHAAAHERYDAALRYLARTQKVSGAWGEESPIATALVLLAFVRGGHTDRSGDYKPQMTRAVRWLLGRVQSGTAEPVLAWAMAELATATGAHAHLDAQERLAELSLTPADDLDRACLALAQGKAAPDTIMLPTKRDERWALMVALLASMKQQIPDEVRTTLERYQSFDGSNNGGVLLPNEAPDRPGSTSHAATAALALICH